MIYLFGIPFYKTKIDKILYDKKEIIDNITFNYKKNKKRNKWDSDSNFHHSYNDEKNNTFKQINYSSLIPLYNEKIKIFLNTITKNPVNFSFKIVNYTCSSENQFMKTHSHLSNYATFSAVHYLKFNNKIHNATTFLNPLNFTDYIPYYPEYKSFIDSVEKDKIENSWLYEEGTIKTEEDDFVISPSCIKHYVKNTSKTKELRMTIALNINISNNNDSN